MERVKLDNKRILFNLLPAHVAQHFLMSNPRNMVSLGQWPLCPPSRAGPDPRLLGCGVDRCSELACPPL